MAGHDRENASILPIEIGLIVTGQMDEVDTQAVVEAQTDLLNHFQDAFAEFDWNVEIVWRRELADGARLEAMPLIDMAREERDGRDWDFVFVITPADLIAHYQAFAFAAVAGSIDTAVISTMRIDPRIDNPLVDVEQRIEMISRRLVAMMRQSLGLMNSLDHADDPDNLMFAISAVRDLDHLASAPWTMEQRESLADNLRLVADLRLEESGAKAPGTLAFYLKSCWINRHEIADAVVRARPWEFPVRLNRLTTAAFSTAIILLMTAETWDLAVRQPGAALGALSIMAILLTTIYVTTRQRLLIRREKRLSEQSVVTNVSAVGVVFVGMLATFSLILAIIACVSFLLFRADLVNRWTGLPSSEVAWQHYSSLATLIAALAVIVGAFGASFEEQSHFRYVTFVDEEI